MVKVFGEIGNVRPDIGVGIFELTIVILVLLRFILVSAKRWAEINDYEVIHEKIVTELLQLGIISFIIFLGKASSISSFENEGYLVAFDLAHIVILFVAFAFVVQACFLVQVMIPIMSKCTCVSLD